MLVVSLVTLGSPDQLTGGYLYDRLLVDHLRRHSVSNTPPLMRGGAGAGSGCSGW